MIHRVIVSFVIILYRRQIVAAMIPTANPLEQSAAFHYIVEATERADDL